MRILKADTQVKVVIGPVVAVGDGFTPVATLSLSTADEAELMKHDAAAVTDISGNTFAAITSMDGYYNLTLTAAQLDTEGMLTVGINDDSLCLPVYAEFMVVNANVYDSFYAAAATDYLQVDALQLGGSTQSATDLKDFADEGYDPATNKVQGVVLVDTTTTTTTATNVTTVNGIAAGAVVSIVDQWETQSQADPTGFHVNVLEWNGTAVTTSATSTKPEVDVNSIDDSANAATQLGRSAGQIIFGTVNTGITASSTTSFAAEDITEATSSHYNGRLVIFLDGALAGQATDITGYTLTSGEGVFTVTALTEAPADAVTFIIV